MYGRFVREGRVAAKLNHPGIVTIYAADVFEGRSAIVMELVPGPTLATLMHSGAIEPPQAVSILDQLLETLTYAHDHGVVHRDIKPDNVFAGERGRVKLADFGVALVPASEEDAELVVGTPGYMAPEQVRGEPVDAQADVFAMGVLAYELFSGVNPFGAGDGSSPHVVMERILSEEPKPLVTLSGASHRLSPVVARALAKDRAQRYSTADEMRQDILRAGVSPTALVPAGTDAHQRQVSPAVADMMSTTVEAAKKAIPEKHGNAWMLGVAGLLSLGAIALFFSMGGAGDTVWPLVAVAFVGLGWWVYVSARGPRAPKPVQSLPAQSGDTVQHSILLRGSGFERKVQVRLPFVIGRGSDADVRLDDPKVSRAHVRVSQHESGGVIVRDLNSRNGTIVEGQMTATAIVQTFGSFQVGDTIVTVME
jgi:hypothetical protein